MLAHGGGTVRHPAAGFGKIVEQMLQRRYLKVGAERPAQPMAAWIKFSLISQSLLAATGSRAGLLGRISSSLSK